MPEASEHRAHRRSQASSYELLRDTYDHDSVALIYQTRLRELFYDLADAGRALGMEIHIETKISRERVYSATGSSLIERPIPPEIPERVFRLLDGAFAANRDGDFRGAARMALLESIHFAAESRPFWSGFAVLARVELGRATERDKEAIKTLPSGLAKQFAKALEMTDNRATWLEGCAHFSGEPDPESLRAGYMMDYPEFGARLTQEHVSAAMKAWGRRGGARPTDKALTKWETLAKIMDEIGLGPIAPKSLQEQSVRHFRRYRQAAQPDR